MQNTDVSSLNHTMQETKKWLDELVDDGPFDTEQQAYSHLRAVLHSIRDRLTVEEATHLASQLPMLVRGFYYEGWRPALAPNDEDTEREFFDSVRESLAGDRQTSAAVLKESVQSIIALLGTHLTDGQIRHVRGQMPEEIRELWNAPAAGMAS